MNPQPLVLNCSGIDNLMRIPKLLLLLVSTCAIATAQPAQRAGVRAKLVREVNEVVRPRSNNPIAIVGATLVDGRGGPVIADSVVLIRGERITAVGKRGSISIPAGAETFDGKGLTLLPGLIDAHFHID